MLSRNTIFKQVANGFDLSTEIQISQCIHSYLHQNSYISYHKGSDMKMLTKIIDLRIIKDREQTKKMIKKYLHRLRAYTRRCNKYQNNDLLPTNLLEICSLINKIQVIYLSRPYIDGHNLYYYLFRRETEFLASIPINHFFKSLLMIQTNCEGIRQHLLTETNIFIDKYFNIACNYSSMVGLGFISGDQMISKSQFYQIYPYLDSDILNREPLERNNFNLKIRGIVVNLLKLIMQQEFNLINERRLQEQIDPKDKQLNGPIVKDVSKLFKNYLEKNSKKISRLQKAYDQSHYIDENSKQIDFKRLFTEILVEQRSFTSFQQFIQQYFYVQDNRKTEIRKLFQIMHNQCWKNQDPTRKKILQQKGLHTLAFYLPIKWGINMSKLFRTEYWFDGLIDKDINDDLEEINNAQMQRIAFFVFQEVKVLQEINNQRNQERVNKSQQEDSLKNTESTANRGKTAKNSSVDTPINKNSVDDTDIANELDRLYEIARNFIKQTKILKVTTQQQQKKVISMHPISRII